MKQHSSRGLVWDIETSPIISYNWGIWEQNAIEIIEDYQILSVAWQWVGEKKVYCVGQDDFKSYKPGVNDDTDVVKALWKLLDKCDYAIAHNGDSFDVKKANTRFMVRELPPPSPYKQIDTKKIARRVAGYTSNRLKDLARDLHVNQKGDPGGFGTWKGCLAGDKKAWSKMKRYNRQDIPPLMDLYIKFRAWDKNGFNYNVADQHPESCPKCGESDMRPGMKYYSTKNGRYQYWRCADCGGVAKQRLAEKQDKDMRMKYVS